MVSDFWFAIGVMSGTSLDGIDFVYATFDKKNYKNFSVLFAKTTPYSLEWKEKLQKAISFSKEKLQHLHIAYAELLAKELATFICEFNIDKIDFVASHGHTILHQPDKGITLQIGDGQIIADRTKQKVICDFRTQDVAFGGQGAPLVPVGDELLFSEYKYCLNLGGFANISFNEKTKRIAFDICPVNIVLNIYAEKLGFDYDDRGTLASKGTLNTSLLNDLNDLEFYKQHPPKSLGLEWVQAQIFPIIDTYKISEKDILRTFVEHIAIQISKQLEQNTRVLVTGGGAFNDYLLLRIEHFKNIELEVPSQKIINYKEALVFAFLGLLRIENKVNCLQSVTGALKDHSSGVIFIPKTPT